MAPTTPSALASVEINNTTFVFYVNSQRNIGYLEGPAAAAEINQQTKYTQHQVLVDGAPVEVVKGFKHLGAIAYKDLLTRTKKRGSTYLRVYYVAENPKDSDDNILREIASEDLGKTWFSGVLGAKNGVIYSVLQGSGINAVVLPGIVDNTNELRVYFTIKNEQCLAVTWMPLSVESKGHENDWNIASRLRSIDEPW
ncbi:hypothetical protein IQ07DRAFT_646889 [Pyrenochaeta sp. DS3sAY3a]|nr:hypothetical protein IQ07DRAFT_646889 [Pyrenochaeta sp. DS3sAY3a]